MSKLLIGFVISMFLTTIAFATTYVWTGEHDDQWHQRENWERGSYYPGYGIYGYLDRAVVNIPAEITLFEDELISNLSVFDSDIMISGNSINYCELITQSVYIVGGQNGSSITVADLASIKIGGK